MTKRQEDKLNMYNSVLTHCAQNGKLTTTIPALQNAISALQTTVAAISSTVQQQMQSTKGYAAGKADNNKTLCSFANEIAGALYVWATDQKDPVTKEKTKTSTSALLRLRDEELAPVCRIYLDLAIAHEQALADYGLSKSVIDAFTIAISSYESAVPAPRNAIANRMAYRNKLAELYTAADAILKGKIDKLSLPLKKTNAEFITAYKANRAIVNSGTTTTALRIIIKDEKTMELLSDALVQIEKIDFESKTGAAGEVIAKPIPQGTYTAQIKKEGYQPATLTGVKVTQGKTNTMEIVLKKSA